jgi:hypothetical protein
MSSRPPGMATFKFSKLHFTAPAGGHTTAGSKVPPGLKAARRRRNHERTQLGPLRRGSALAFEEFLKAFH